MAQSHHAAQTSAGSRGHQHSFEFLLGHPTCDQGNVHSLWGAETYLCAGDFAHPVLELPELAIDLSTLAGLPFTIFAEHPFHSQVPLDSLKEIGAPKFARTSKSSQDQLPNIHTDCGVSACKGLAVVCWNLTCISS